MGSLALRQDPSKYFRYTLRYQSDALRLGLSSEKPLPSYVSTSLLPYVTIEAEPCRCTYSIVVLERGSVSLPASSFGRAATIPLHCSRQGVLQGTRPGPLLIDTVGVDISYIVDDKSVYVVGDVADSDVQVDLIRIIRAVLEAMLYDLGYSKLHMGQLGVRETGVGICGSKGSGKTTLICRILATVPGTLFCSNDKSYVSIQGDRIAVIGIPQRIGIQDGTLSKYPNLARRVNLRAKEKNYVWPLDVAEAFGTRLVPVGNLDLMLTPAFDLSRPAVSVDRLSPAEIDELLTRDVFRFSDNVHPAWLTDLLKRPEVQSSQGSPMRQALTAMPWYRIGGDFYSDSFLSALLSLLEDARLWQPSRS